MVVVCHITVVLFITGSSSSLYWMDQPGSWPTSNCATVEVYCSSSSTIVASGSRVVVNRLPAPGEKYKTTKLKKFIQDPVREIAKIINRNQW